MKNTTLTLLLVFFALINLATAQRASLNIDLTRKLENIKPNSLQDEVLEVMIKGDLEAIQIALRDLDGQYKYGSKNIAAARISAKKIKVLQQNLAIERIEYYDLPMRQLGDFLRVNNNLDSLHQGLGCLPQGVDGEGVVVGIIDQGIEWQHPDFQNADGSTRIKYVWDQLVGNITNVAYGYGYEWTEAQINNGSIQHDPYTSGNGHGTGSAGAAAGGGMAVAGKYTGAAPKSDIIHVNIRGASYPNSFVDGIHYIFQKANEMGKPCVINSSLGSYRGSHDTRALYIQYVENLLDEQAGRAIVQAAGNGADIRQHLGYQVTTDTVFSWFKRNNNNLGYVYFDLFADKSDFDNVHFALACRDKFDYSFKGMTPFYNMQTDFPNLGSTTQVVTKTIFHPTTNEDMGEVQIYAQLNDGVYDMAFAVFPTVATDYWEFTTTGDGYFDVWSNGSLMGTSSVEPPNNLPDAATYPPIANYKLADTLRSIVAGINCSPKVISVGNYSASTSWVGYDGGTYYNSVTGGAKVVGSSVGPTRTGLMKPDISASGNFTFGPQVLTRLTELRTMPDEADRLAEEGWHVRWSGTSIAAPVVAGTIACYFQQFPNADYTQVKNDLMSSAKVDERVIQDYGFAPNNGWGAGKLDGYNFVNEALLNAYEQAGTNLETEIYVFLEGAMDDAALPALKMKTTLLNRGLLPGQIPLNPNVAPTPSVHPFTDTHWFYDGPEAGFDDLDYQQIAAENGGHQVVDWVILSLRTGLDASTNVFRKAALLLENGKVVFPDKCALVPPGQDFYIVIEHRSHMAAISHTAVSITGNILAYDFRNQDSYSTPTSFGQKELYPNTWTLYGGDGVQSDELEGYDTNGKDLQIWVPSNGFFDVYLPEDYDLNGDVNGGDKVIWSNNNGGSSRTDKVDN